MKIHERLNKKLESINQWVEEPLRRDAINNNNKTTRAQDLPRSTFTCNKTKTREGDTSLIASAPQSFPPHNRYDKIYSNPAT